MKRSPRTISIGSLPPILPSQRTATKNGIKRRNQLGKSTPKKKRGEETLISTKAEKIGKFSGEFFVSSSRGTKSTGVAHRLYRRKRHLGDHGALSHRGDGGGDNVIKSSSCLTHLRGTHIQRCINYSCHLATSIPFLHVHVSS